MMYVLTRIVWLIFLPSNFVILLFAVGVALCWTSRVRLGRIIATVAAVAGLALVLLPLDQWAAAPLETRYLRPAKPPAHVDGILILGGYFSNLVEGAAVARRYPEARVVYSGGSSYLFGDDGSPQYALETLRSLGVDPARIVIEGKSRTTFEDIQYSRALVAPKKGQLWLLVTTAVHMTRAKAVANHFGWPMTPWTSENIADASLKTYWLFDYAKTSYNLGRVLHEYEALLAYRIEGKIDTMSP